MRLTTLALFICLFALSPACEGGGAARDSNAARTAATAEAAQTPAPAAVQLPRSVTCALLPDEDVREVQGEAPTEAQGSEHLAGPISTSQCYYKLANFKRSFSLEVVRTGQDAPAGALREHWRKQFNPDAIEERERIRKLEEERTKAREEELRREREAGQTREGGRRRKKNRESEDARPQRVPGVGRDAYWSGNPNMATLSVLGKDAVVRIVVGGPEDDAERIKRAAELARRVLKRL